MDQMDVRNTALAQIMNDGQDGYRLSEPNLNAEPIRGGMNRHEGGLREDRNGIKINNVRERLPNG